MLSERRCILLFTTDTEAVRRFTRCAAASTTWQTP
jgi:hypothetical protein